MNALIQTFTEQQMLQHDFTHEKKLIPFHNNQPIDKAAIRQQLHGNRITINEPTEEEAKKCEDENTILAKRKMNDIPLPIYNTLLGFYIENDRLRDAMFLVLGANTGMRYSDLCRLKFSNLINSFTGDIRPIFSLKDGEKKTGKKNVYYNNLATEIIIRMYLSQNPRDLDDYLFTAEGNHKKKENGKLQPLTRKAMEVMLKKSLVDIGIITKNNPDRDKYLKNGKYECIEQMINTHSLRNTFSENFYVRADEMMESGELKINWNALELLKQKLMHSNLKVTEHYTSQMRKAYAQVCANLDIGLETLVKYYG